MRAYVLTICAAIVASHCGASPFSALSENEKLTAVSSSTFNGYVRTRMPDGSYAPETYAFGDGGNPGFIFMADPSFDDVSFLRLAHTLALPLARQAYLPTRDSKTTNLLIMVSWGTTFGAINTSDGYTQDVLNYQNARLLGFGAEAPFQGMYDPLSDPSANFWGPSYREIFMQKIHGSVMSAIEVNRYYVILHAYDFQAAWREKRLKLLWETRFSLSQRRHSFGDEVPAMAQAASLYFGQDSYGLIVRPVPVGRVEVGEPMVLDESPEEGDLSGIAGDWRGRSPAFPAVVIHVEPGGRSTFENPKRNWTVPANVSIKGDAVTIKVPGWGYIFRGTLKGNKMTGTLSRYLERGSFTLRKDPNSIPAGRLRPGKGSGK